jgi:hypothetical protein
MKRLLPVLILFLLLLSACSPSTPAVPTQSMDVILAAVAQTLTAYPSQTPVVILATAPASTPTSLAPTASPPAPTATLMPTVVPTSVLLYPTAVIYPPPVIHPPTVPTWSPAYLDQFIQFYFQRINARDYPTTWSLLTAAFKAAVNSETSGGYGGYSAFWNTVLRVDVLNVTITSWSGNDASVLVNMIYNYYDGRVISSNQAFHLFYDSWRGVWMFDSAAAPAPTSIPTAIPTGMSLPSYPADFIYYYFHNINARNYGLTWSLLSASFIANNNPPSEGGYAGYAGFWDSVSRVDISYITVTYNSGGYADVSVGLVYNYNTGLVTTANPVYHLLYNYSLGNWQFYSP